MTTTFLLVRHAEHELQGKILTGRMPGVGLGPLGREQAVRLAQVLAGRRPVEVRASPRQRAQETASPLAAALRLTVETEVALDEIDFGAWTGKSFAELDRDPLWDAWNARRAEGRPPGGESMAEVQSRVMACLRKAATADPERPIVLVSHGDVIKAIVLDVLGAPFGSLHTFEIAPASVSTIVLGNWGSKIISLNEQVSP
jgi:broad specificity phosphatase PhoE